ncbi:MAG: hypothetical protein IPF93_14795 [Saprospiraceae bacterium]|nr:hypothetical protein [Saprospiraceae bacterium]
MMSPDAVQITGYYPDYFIPFRRNKLLVPLPFLFQILDLQRMGICGFVFDLAGATYLGQLYKEGFHLST